MIEKHINNVFQMDNLELMKKLPDDSIDLIYGDILYGTGKKFKDYEDNLWGNANEAVNWYRPRLLEMKRVLASKGNLLIHCDWHLDSYLRVELDRIFGDENFRNTIIWKRSNDSGSSKSKARKLPVCTDTILWYSKTKDYTFKMPTVPYDEKLLKRFKYDDNDGKGKYYWADLRTYSNKRMQELKIKNEVKQRNSGKYSYKRYLNKTQTEKALLNIWDDINRLTSNNKESKGYFSQKPKDLIHRIIKMCSNKCDIVFDPFMGSGTTLIAAKELGRNYIGCDIQDKAIEITKQRLNIQ